MRLLQRLQWRGCGPALRLARSASVASSNCTLTSGCLRISLAVRLRHASLQRRIFGERSFGRALPQYRQVVGRVGAALPGRPFPARGERAPERPPLPAPRAAAAMPPGGRGGLYKSLARPRRAPRRARPAPPRRGAEKRRRGAPREARDRAACTRGRPSRRDPRCAGGWPTVSSRPRRPRRLPGSSPARIAQGSAPSRAAGCRPRTGGAWRRLQGPWQGGADQGGPSASAAGGDAGEAGKCGSANPRPGPAGPRPGKAAHAAPRQGDVPQAAPKGGRPDEGDVQAARPHGRRAGGVAGFRAMHAAAVLDGRRRAGSGMAGEEDEKELYSGERIGMRSPSIPRIPAGRPPSKR